jgi:tRNA-2-methylthio-N6-dimethylallyladenosine synthase
MPRVFLETFGCQMNVADSDLLGDLLAMRGYSRTTRPAEADLLVVNTCSVREKAEVRAQARIREYGRTKGRGQTLWVIGCMAERLGEQLKTQIPGIDRVIGAKTIETIHHDIDEYLAGTMAETTARNDSAAPISLFIPIMRGCDNYCSYCIVPLVRGPEHSIPASEILSQARHAVTGGAREIVLLGQNVNSYRDREADFSDLLVTLEAVEGLARIRFTTSHPKDLGEKLIATMARLPKLCRHVHLPVQSGSTRILGLMNRRYSREDYLRRIELIRRYMPNADITTDVMVGFPGETAADFQDTLALFRDVRFTAAFQFAFSPRAGTAAAGLAGQVPAEVKKERLTALIALQTGITKQAYAAMVGATAAVLFTQRQDDDPDMWMGQDEGCKRVLLRCTEELAGTILTVKIVKSTGMTLIAERDG